MSPPPLEIQPGECETSAQRWRDFGSLALAVRESAFAKYNELQLSPVTIGFSATLSEADSEMGLAADLLEAVVDRVREADSFDGSFESLGAGAPIARMLRRSINDEVGSDVTDVYVDRRIEYLRDLGLVGDEDPGGSYRLWIRNSVENGVDLTVVIDIARDHGIRPESFDVIAGMREIKDDDGKSFFLLPTDISPKDARDAVVMTFILNAGTGYRRSPGMNGARYSSAEVQRIIDRQEANDTWSYSNEGGVFPNLDNVHSGGGRLVTTPNGMLMGLGYRGNWIKERLVSHGGTTYGDIFLLNDHPDEPVNRLVDVIESGGKTRGGCQEDLDQLLHHEEIHAQQAAREGLGTFMPKYLDEATDIRWVSGPYNIPIPVPVEVDASRNEYEIEAGLEDGGKLCGLEPSDHWVDNEGVHRDRYGHAIDPYTEDHLDPHDEDVVA